MTSRLPLVLTGAFVLLTFAIGPFALPAIYLAIPLLAPLIVGCMLISHYVKVFAITFGFWEPQPPPADNSPTFYVTTGPNIPRALYNKHALRDAIVRYMCGNPDRWIHISQWDISRVYDMRFVFHNLIQTKQDNDAIAGIEDWDMSHVENIGYMFCGCVGFNRPIGKWRLPLVEDVSHLFYDCRSFFQPLDEWKDTLGTDVYGPINIESVFYGTDRQWQRHPWLERLERRNYRYTS